MDTNSLQSRLDHVLIDTFCVSVPPVAKICETKRVPKNGKNCPSVIDSFGKDLLVAQLRPQKFLFNDAKFHQVLQINAGFALWFRSDFWTDFVQCRTLPSATASMMEL